MRRYFNTRRKQRIKHYGRGIPRSLYSGARQSLIGGYGGFGNWAGTEAKRFVTAFALDTLKVGFTNFRLPLTTIPRNLTSTVENSDSRVGRQIHVKGVSLNYFINATINNNVTAMVRFLCVWQKDPDEDIFDGLDFNQFYSPIGTTRALKVITDKYTAISGPDITNGRNAHLWKMYRKVGRMTKYDGSNVNGSDISTGAIIVYVSIDPTQAGNTEINLAGTGTISYRETQ